MKKLRGFLVETFMWVYRYTGKCKIEDVPESLFLTFIIFGAIFFCLYGIISIVLGNILPSYFGINFYNFYIVSIIVLALGIAWGVWAYYDMIQTGLYKKLLRLPRYEWNRIRIRAYAFIASWFIVLIALQWWKEFCEELGLFKCGVENRVGTDGVMLASPCRSRDHEEN